MKYKVGQRVRLLPSATKVMVPYDEVGKPGKLTFVTSDGFNMNIHMDKPREGNRLANSWGISHYHIESIIEKGQQLLFSFMEE